MSLLSTRRVRKSYAGQVVLDGLNVEVEEGEFVTIVVASGSGKTTFLKLLLGTEASCSGEILLDGRHIPAEPGPDRGIVFQRYSVFPHLCVVDNVMMAIEFAAAPLLGRLFGTQRRAARSEAMTLLEEVGLERAANKYPHELSGGMQQRLALAQALLRHPRVLLHTCPHPLAPAGEYPRRPIEVRISDADPVAEDDYCRNWCPENERGYRNNALYHLGTSA